MIHFLISTSSTTRVICFICYVTTIQVTLVKPTIIL
jgi:hypothetical protein